VRFARRAGVYSTKSRGDRRRRRAEKCLNRQGPKAPRASRGARGPIAGRAGKNRQAAVTPRPDPWASLYLVRIVGTGPRALMILVPHVCGRPRARADNPDHGRGSERRLDLGCGNLGWPGRRSVGTERIRTKPSSALDDDFG